MNPMPKKSNHTNRSKHRSTESRAGKKTRSKTTAHRRAKSSRAGKTNVHRRAQRKATGITYVFECTRQGCGYQIVREEKADTGKLRFDLKCPKCHNREFKCLGPGDLPMPELGVTTTALEESRPAPELDFDNAGRLNLGSS